MERIWSAISGISVGFDSASFRNCSNFSSIFRERSAANLFCSLKSASFALSSFLSDALIRARIFSISSSLTWIPSTVRSFTVSPIFVNTGSACNAFKNFARKSFMQEAISNTDISVPAKYVPNSETPIVLTAEIVRSRSASAVISSPAEKQAIIFVGCESSVVYFPFAPTRYASFSLSLLT